MGSGTASVVPLRALQKEAPLAPVPPLPLSHSALVSPVQGGRHLSLSNVQFCFGGVRTEDGEHAWSLSPAGSDSEASLAKLTPSQYLSGLSFSSVAVRDVGKAQLMDGFQSLKAVCGAKR